MNLGTWRGQSFVQSELRRRLETCRNLPTLPGIAVEVLKLCQQEDLDLSKIARAISLDPALASKILHAVNSPFYGLPRTVHTISNALVVLGVNTVRMLALSFSLAPAATKSGSRGFDLQKYWRRSIIAGLSALELAHATGLRAEDEAFLGALLQDIGMLAMSRLQREDYDRICTEAGDDHDRLVAVERERLGCDHAEIGSWLVQHWGLPAPLYAVVRASHEESLVVAGDIREPLLSGIVAVSGPVADIWLAGDPILATTQACERAERYLGLDRTRLEPLLGRVAQALTDVAPLFDVDPGSPDEIHEILECAKETMLMVSLEVSTAAQIAKAQAMLLEGQANQLAAAAQRLAKSAETDPLTGLFNRVGLEARLMPLFEEAMSRGKKLAVLMCDLDHFKKINDTHGHPAGDKVLVAVAEILKGHRECDFAARWGGEEFVLVLPGTNALGAHVVAERLRAQIANCNVGLEPGEMIKVTMSLGAAVQGEPVRFESVGGLLQAADIALYQAKKQGRNRSVLFKAEAPP
jgi:diguanylate cyclase (GGDEF)-like protein